MDLKKYIKELKFKEVSDIRSKKLSNNYRLARVRKTDKLYFIDNNSNRASFEFDWISDQINGYYLIKNGSSLFIIDENSISGSDLVITPVPFESVQTGPNAKRVSNSASQIFVGKENNSLFLDDDNNISPLFKEVTEANKSGCRIGLIDKGAYIIKDETNVLGLIPNLDSLNFEESKTYPYVMFGPKKEKTDDKIFIPSKKPSDFVFCKDATALNDKDFVLTLDNGEKEIINNKGKIVSGNKTFSDIQTNDLGEVLVRTTPKSKLIFLKREGTRYKRPRLPIQVITNSKNGLKFVYNKETKEYGVAGVDALNADYSLNKDILLIFDAILQHKKPSSSILKRLENNQELLSLSEGKNVYFELLDQIKTQQPEIAAEIDQTKDYIQKTLLKTLNRRKGGQKGVQRKEDRSIRGRKLDILISEQKIADAQEKESKYNEIIETLQK